MAPFFAAIHPVDMPVLATAADARSLFAAGFHGLVVEEARIAFVGDGCRLIATARLSDHDPAMLRLPLHAVLATALGIRATALVLAHNHPFGDPTPSLADIAATRTLATACRLVGLRLIDHLIFGRRNCASFRGLGLL